MSKCFTSLKVGEFFPNEVNCSVLMVNLLPEVDLNYHLKCFQQAQ